MRIGVLAIQGDFEKHLEMSRQLDVEASPIKTAAELNACDALILPGGESTTFVNLLHKHGLWEEIKTFAQYKPVFGTCAGLIVLSDQVINNKVKTLGIVNIDVERNAYGRQIDSFIDTLQLDLGKGRFDFEGVFIRAPKIRHIGQGVHALGWYGDDVVLAEMGNTLVATFHPELTANTKIHEYFINKVKS
jgi:5'-phosphate synthase pdxT subunit